MRIIIAIDEDVLTGQPPVQAIQPPVAEAVPGLPPPQRITAEPPIPAGQPPIATQPQDTNSLVAKYVKAYGNEKTELRNAIYSSGERRTVLNSISSIYNQFAGHEQDDLIELIFNFPDQKDGTIGKWLEKARREHFDDPEYEARSMIWRALLNWEPGEDLLNKLGQAYVGSKFKNEVGRIGQEESRNLLEAKHALSPYIRFLQNTFDPPAGSRPVDEDLLEKIGKKFSEDDAIWEQYKRDFWLDKDENGPGRADRAKTWWVEQLSKIKKEDEAAGGSSSVKDEYVKPVIKDETIEFAKRILPVKSGFDPSDVSKRMSWLKNPTGMPAGQRPKLNIGTSASSDPSWLPVADLYLREYGITEAKKYQPGMLPFDEWLIGKMKAVRESGKEVPDSFFLPYMHTRWYSAAKSILSAHGYPPELWKKSAPGLDLKKAKDRFHEHWLTSEMVDPGKGGIGKSFIKYVRDLMKGGSVSLTGTDEDDVKPFEVSIEDTLKAPNKKDDLQPRSSIDIDDPFNAGDIDEFIRAFDPSRQQQLAPQKHWIQPGPDNPRFKEIIQYIVRDMYSPYSVEQGDNNEVQQRTDAVLYEIGRFYSGLQASTDPQDMRQIALHNEEAENEVLERLKRQNLLDEPLALAHVADDPSYNDDQRYYLALRECIIDIADYAAEHERELSQLFGVERKNVSAMLKLLKTASFLVACRQAMRALAATEATEPCRSQRK